MNDVFGDTAEVRVDAGDDSGNEVEWRRGLYLRTVEGCWTLDSP